MLRITDIEEEGWEVMKRYLLNNLASDSEDERQLSWTRSEPAANKKKRETNKQKDKKTVLECPLPEKILKSIGNHTQDTAILGVTLNLTKSVLHGVKKGIFYISTQTLETKTKINSSRDWESADKTFQYVGD